MKKLLYLILLVMFFCTSMVYAEMIEVKFDFENYIAEDDAKLIDDFTYEWEVFTAKAATNYVRVAEEGSNKFLHFNGYTEVRTWDLIEGPYTFSFDARTEETINVAFFVRGVLPVTRFNPANGGGVDQTLFYLEADWYRENGGKNGSSGLGGSGLYLMPLGSSKIRINIKTYEPDGINVGTAYYDLDWPEATDPTKFFNVKFVDNGSDKVEIFINNKLLATVTMSNPGVYEEDEYDSNRYYKTAVVTNASGEEILNINNARLSADGSQLAIATRNKVAHIDNLNLLSEREATPEPTEKPTPAPTQSDEQSATEEPKPQPTSTKSQDSDDDSDGGLNIIVIAAVVGGVIVVGTGIALAIVFNKKK